VPDARANGPLLPGRFGDESELAQSVAALYENMQSVIIATDGRCFLDGQDERFEYAAAPPGADANLVWIEAILQAARQDGRRVILTAEAGNFVVSWAGQGLIGHYLRHGQAGAAWREARALAGRGQARSPWRALAGQGLIPLLPVQLWELLERVRGRRPQPTASLFRSAFAAEHGLSAEASGRALARGARLGADGRQLRYSYAANLVKHHVPAWRAQFGVDARDPTRDQRLVEFCLALPPDQFQRDGQSRRLIRRAMAGRLPSPVLENPQRGQQSSDWLYRLRAHREDAAASLRQIQANAFAARVLDLPRMRRLIDTWPEPQPDGDPGNIDEYRALQEALVVGRFIVWAESGS
jgi:asparagine synthase (glutamine-hydrolysing)